MALAEVIQIQVTELIQTCNACPAQWEGRTADDRAIYVRYRWGYLSIRVSEPGRPIHEAVSGVEVMGIDVGDDLSGYMSGEELINHTRGQIKWPEPLRDMNGGEMFE